MWQWVAVWAGSHGKIFRTLLCISYYCLQSTEDAATGLCAVSATGRPTTARSPTAQCRDEESDMSVFAVKRPEVSRWWAWIFVAVAVIAIVAAVIVLVVWG